MASRTKEFTSAHASATIDLHAGGRLTSLVVRGEELLVSEDDSVFGYGSFPMVPWAGRLNRGQFVFEETEWSMPINLPPHAIHGTATSQEWVEQADGTIVADLGPTWPFGGTASQKFTLSDARLHCELSIHAADRAMPALAGWHPWFRRTLSTGAEATLDVHAASMYELDETAIPTGTLITPPAGPWDNCFTGLTADPTISWGDELEITLSSSCTDWVIYTEPAHAICVEPQTGPPDQFNRSPVVLAPGQSLTAWFAIDWSTGDERRA